MRDLYNHAYGTNYTNQQLCAEIDKSEMRLFTGLFQFAIQMREKGELKSVDTIDQLKGAECKFLISKKNYAPLKTPVSLYGAYKNILFVEPTPEIKIEPKAKKELDSEQALAKKEKSKCCLIS